MSENLILNIRPVKNGFVATFSGENPGCAGDEFAAMAPADLRAVIDDEIADRVSAAWCEDHRGETAKELIHRTLGNAMASPVSGNWKGYWQRAA